MIRFPTAEADELRRSEVSHTLTFALAFGAATVFFTIAAAMFGYALALPFAGYLVALVFVGGGLTIGITLLTGLRRGRRVVARVLEIAERWLDVEIELKSAARAALPSPAPALPAPERAIPWNHDGRVEQIPVDLVHGLDPRDLRFLCRLLANGFKFTEQAMEKIVLPYSGETMGKAEGNTPYARFMALCVAAGVITGRGGPGNPSGKLAVTDPDEMYKRLKAVPAVEMSADK